MEDQCQGRGTWRPAGGGVRVGGVEVCLGNGLDSLSRTSPGLDRASPEPGCSYCQADSRSRVLG